MRPNSSKSTNFLPSNYSTEDLKHSNDHNRAIYEVGCEPAHRPVPCRHVPSVPHLGGSYQAVDSSNSSTFSPSNYTAEDIHQTIDCNRSIYNVERGHAHRPIPYRHAPSFLHLGGSYQAVESSNSSRFLKSNVSAANQNQAIVDCNRALNNAGRQRAHRPVPYRPVPSFPHFDGSSQASPHYITYNQPNFAPYESRFHSPYNNNAHQIRFRPTQQGHWQQHFPPAHQNSLGPRQQGQWQHHFPTTSDRNTCNGYHDDARYIHANSSRSFTPSRPFNRSPNLSIRPENAANMRISEDSLDSVIRDHIYRKATNLNNYSGRMVQNLAKTPWERSKFHEIKRSLGYEHKVWHGKDQFQTSTSSYMHAHKDRIRWNGFEESSEPVGGNCEICKKDFGFAPNYNGSEANFESAFYNLPNVSVLPCGHAFHSECLRLTPEHSTDPLCHICSKD